MFEELLHFVTPSLVVQAPDTAYDDAMLADCRSRLDIGALLACDLSTT